MYICMYTHVYTICICTYIYIEMCMYVKGDIDTAIDIDTDQVEIYG